MKAAIIGAVIGAALALTYVTAMKNIASDCKNFGVFVVGKESFVCKLKEKNT